MYIFVNTYSGKTITLHVKSNDIIGTVKEQIYHKENISPKYQRLVYEGFDLSDSNKLKYYKIKANSTIHLSIKIKGGWETGVCGAATVAQTAVETPTMMSQTMLKILRWITGDAAKAAQIQTHFVAKFTATRAKFIWGIAAFDNFMRTIFQFFVIIVIARMIVGFFSKPLEFIMLGMACVFLSVI